MRFLGWRKRLKGIDEFDPRQRIRFWPDEPVRKSWHGMNQRRPRLPRYLRRTNHEVTLRGLVHETIQWLGRFTLAGIAIGITLPLYDPAVVDPPRFLSAEPEPVSASFTRCGPGRGFACVIDGDTFKLGERKVRIIGIDAPEVKARCPAEAAQAEAATAKLQELLDQGPFEMVAPVYGTRDRYGRDLRSLRRTRPDGSTQSIAEEMRNSGLARRYLGGFRSGWC